MTSQILDLARLEEQRLAKKIDLISFGPCDITERSWRRLSMILKTYNSKPDPKEVIVALFGKLEGNRFVVRDLMQMAGENSLSECVCDVNDLKKAEKAFSKEGFCFIGMIHNHPSGSTKPSHKDQIAYFSLMLEFDRPLYYYIAGLKENRLKVSAYSIHPPEKFIELKDSVCFIEFEMPKSSQI